MDQSTGPMKNTVYNPAHRTPAAGWMDNYLNLSKCMIKANENFEGLIRKWGWNIENERLSLSGRIAGHHFLGNSEDVPSTSHPFAISEILKASMEENSTANVVQTREPPIYANIAEKEVPGIQRKRKPLIVYRSEPHDASKRVQEMLERRDASLRYINDGNAIVNPFAVSKREQLKFLRNSFCRAKAEGGYECAVCRQERWLLRDMDKHLLGHSDSKFYLCVRCFKGFNDTFDMKRHNHVRPYACAQCSCRFTQRSLLEGHQRCVHQMTLRYGRNQRREELRVCEACGFVCENYTTLLEHTACQHPTNQDSITKLRRRINNQVP
ncbi:Protein ovo [Echinococcus granulosus]|uniref:Protein ovo n=1 Tax=Echinococcus granulosus TaxID=6210 RepID=W6UCT7_ECHGR|nr:Protein ovo [Echinococcus granulosus]EUB58566.1 Protein ovo [Echinococcus granulosus]